MDGGAWWATVHGVSKSETRLSYFTFTFTLLIASFKEASCHAFYNNKEINFSNNLKELGNR